MKYLILLLIKIYWKTVSPSNRRKCIFRKSCSNYVFEVTQKKGFQSGLKAFWFRYKNCRNGFQIFQDPIDHKIQMILPSYSIVDEKDIAERLVKNQI